LSDIKRKSSDGFSNVLELKISVSPIFISLVKADEFDIFEDVIGDPNLKLEMPIPNDITVI
jgi:hypothetical protein